MILIQKSPIFYAEARITKMKNEVLQNCLTGIPGIDAQHRGIIILLDAFLESLKKENLSPDLIYATLQEIIGSLRSHFSTEENFIGMISFPRTAEHKDMHNNLLNRLADEMQNLKSREKEKVYEFIRTFRYNTVAHFSIYDMDYVAFVENLVHKEQKVSYDAVGA